jgi:hypothetical protein
VSDRLPSGQFPPGVSGNPGGKRKGPTLTKTVRLLLADDPDAWAAVREIESDPSNTEGKHELIKLAVSTVRRARTDNTVLREVFDRVDGKLAAAYSLPDEDDNTRIIRPILYVAPERPEQAERLFRAFGDDEPEPEAERQAEVQPRELAEVKEHAPSFEHASVAPTSGRPEPFFRAFDIAGHELETGRQTPTLPPVRDKEGQPSNTTASKAPDEHTAGTVKREDRKGPPRPKGYE